MTPDTITNLPLDIISCVCGLALAVAFAGLVAYFGESDPYEVDHGGSECLVAESGDCE